MTILTWPSELDPPERDTFSEAWADPRLKRRGETGGPRYRRRFSAVPKLVSMSLFCDRLQKGIFDHFFEQETNFGSRLFWMPDPTTDGWPLVTEDGTLLLTESGVPLLCAAKWLCVFGDDVPVTKIAGVNFRISFSIAVLPR